MPVKLPAETSVGFEQRLADAIAQRISAPRYNLWFRDHTRFVHLGETVVVGVPNLYFHDWLQKTFGDAVRSAVTEVVGQPVAVRFAIDPDLFQAQREAEREVNASTPPMPAETAPPVPVSAPPKKRSMKMAAVTPKRRWRSLTDFVVGPCNRVAHASAQSIVEEPGFGANPLVLYGPTGTGKTHLLEGIYAGLRKRNPGRKVIFVSAEDFMNRFLGSMRNGKAVGFRKQFRECFALLVDDVTFLAGKKATQVEFLHTFDSLVGDGCQVVVSCDSHPRLCEDLMPELADRLLGGAIWGVLPPDGDTRLALLAAKAGDAGPEFPMDVLKFLACNLRGNVRELEGAIHSLRHFARVAGVAVTKDLAREALGDLLRHAIRTVRIGDIDAAICTVLKLPAGGLQAKSKAWAVSQARAIAIYLARKHTSATFSEITAYFGNKTHSAAISAVKKVNGWIEKNESIKAGERAWNVRALLERIERELQR